MRQSRASRVVRGLLAAGVATFAALVSHVTGGGQIPGWIGIVVPFVLSAVVCIVLAGRRPSFWRLSVAVAVSQFFFHSLFVLGAFAPSVEPAAGAHVHAHMAAIATDTAVTMSDGHSGALMWIMHAAAALITIAALYRGERAIGRLHELGAEFAQWARRRVLAAVILLPRIPEPAPAPTVFAPVRALRSVSLSTVTRRGPPWVAVF